VISKDPSPGSTRQLLPLLEALHNRSEQWIFGHSLRHSDPSWPADMHIIRGIGLEIYSSETWSW
jgi:hypothetical protein